MSVMTERKFAVQVVYNGVTKALQVDPGRSSKPRTHTPPRPHFLSIRKGSPFGYEIDRNWLTELWKRLAASQRSIKVQIHTHPGQAFHSSTDDKWPIVAQAGFMSIVIPDFATGEPNLDLSWIGSLQENGTWRRLHSPADALILK